MSKHPEISEIERLKNWFNEGQKAKKDCLFQIRAKKIGRSAAGEWITVSSAGQIPCCPHNGSEESPLPPHADFLLRRTSDGQEVYVCLAPKELEPENETSDDLPEIVSTGSIRMEVDLQIRDAISTLKVANELARQALDNTSKAVTIGKDALDTIIKTRDDAANQSTENAKVAAIKSLSLLAHRALGLITDKMNKQSTTKDQQEFQRYQELKAHAISHDVDISNVPAADMAILVSLYNNPVLRDAINELKKEQITQTAEGFNSVSES